MVDFRFYLNKQGIRGAKGETGDKGYSPEIMVDTETATEYKLRIINENSEIVTPNLRGNTIEVRDPNGDVIKYDKYSGNFYVGTLDIATNDRYGVIKLANSDDILNFSNSAAITPGNISEALAGVIDSPDDSVHIFNNPETNKLELTVDASSISGLETRVEHLEDDALYLENAVNDLSTGLSTTNSNVSALNTSLNGVKSDLTTEAQMRLNADNQQQEAIDAERQQRETQDAALQTQLNSKLTSDNIKQGTNITITKDGNNITINATSEERELSWGSITGNIEDQADLKGQLDAIYDTIGDEVEAIDAMLDLKAEKANTYTKDEVDQIETDLNAHIETVEAEIPTIATTNTAGIVKPDGSTITINEDGTITSIATGDVTAAGNNVFSGVNTFTNEIYFDEARNNSVSIDQYESLMLDSTRDIHINGNDGLSLSGAGTYISFSYNGLNLGNDISRLRGMNIYLERNIPIKVYEGVGSSRIETIIPKLKDFTEGANITLTKDETTGQITISSPEVTELKNKVEELQLYKFPNATIEGDPTINNGQVSNFSTTNYLKFPFEFKTEGRTWLLNGSFDTDSDVTTQQNIIDSLASVALAVRNGRLVLALSTNGTSFDLGEHESMSDIEPNTKYYYRLSFSGTQYLLSISTDKQEWLPEIIITSDQPIASKPMTISSSGHPFKGTLNLNDWDLTVANTLVWQGMDDVGSIASRMDVNASNITESGIDNLKELLGIGNIGSLLDEINGEVI